MAQAVPTAVNHRTATVVAVCLRAEPGLPKHPQGEITLSLEGAVGDFHAGPTDRHAGKNASPNLRQVSIVAQEAIEEVARRLGITLGPGSLGENILLRGLGDLSQLRPGQRLLFSSGPELEVAAQNTPCKNLSTYHPQLPKLLYGRRGVVAVVRTPGRLRPGDTLTLR